MDWGPQSQTGEHQQYSSNMIRAYLPGRLSSDCLPPLKVKVPKYQVSTQTIVMTPDIEAIDTIYLGTLDPQGSYLGACCC